MPHVLVMFFAEAGRARRRSSRASTGAAFADAFDVWQTLETSDLDGVEPFGFADGMSQPAIDWEQATDPGDARRSTTATSRRSASSCSDIATSTASTRTGRSSTPTRPARRCPTPPTIPARRTSAGTAPTSSSGSSARTCAAFWQFVHRATGGEPAAMDRLSSALVGRTRSGEPLATPARRAPGRLRRPDQVRQNRFTFDDDPRGVVVSGRARTSVARTLATPTIRAGPTGVKKLLAALGGSSKGFRDDLVSPVRFHRVLRRGREYGPGLSPEDALAAGATRRAGARAALRVPQRQHRAPVRVPAERLADEHDVRRSEGRDRSDRRHPRAGARLPGHQRLHHAARRRTGRARHRTPAVRHRQRRRVLLPSRVAARCATWREPAVR